MTSSVNTLIFLLLTSVMTWRCDAVSVEILPPVGRTGPEAGLVIVPGAFISGHAYKPLGEAIQANCSARLWVALLEDFLLHLANPLQIGGAVDQAVAKVKAAGLASDVIFIAGHSLGGGIVSQYVQSHSSRFKGAFFFGHYPDFTLSQFPVPAMTLSGDLDGLARLTHMMDKFEELSTDMATDPSALYRSPVLLIKGVNHGHFASGTMPSTVQKNDLSADVTEDTAHALIAPFVTSFLSLHIAQSSDDVAEAKARLQSYYNETRDIYWPLMTTKARDENAGMTSLTSVTGQALVSGVTMNGLNILGKEVDSRGIETQLPTLETSATTVTVSAVTHVVHDSSLFGQSTSPVSPSELQVKMISRDAIVEALSWNGTSVHPTVIPPQSCMNINQNTLHLALSRSSSAARGRYLSRGSKMLIDTPDHVTTSTASWLAEKLDFRQSASNVSVTSAVYRSLGTADTPGLVFCKLLSPYRTMEWIYVDSLRPFTGSTSAFENVLG